MNIDPYIYTLFEGYREYLNAAEALQFLVYPQQVIPWLNSRQTFHLAERFKSDDFIGIDIFQSLEEKGRRKVTILDDEKKRKLALGLVWYNSEKKDVLSPILILPTKA